MLKCFIWLFVLVFVVSACQDEVSDLDPAGEESSVDSSSEAIAPIEPYPAKTVTLPSVAEPYPAAITPTTMTVEEATEILDIPTPTTDLAVVTGLLLRESGDGPYLTTLYLGNTIYANGQEDSPPLVTFSEGESPAGIQDPNTGRFLFTDVPPGEYGIINWTAVVSSLVHDAETQQDLLFEVKANEVKDLGVILIR
jgi:hypothetical protein